MVASSEEPSAQGEPAAAPSDPDRAEALRLNDQAVRAFGAGDPAGLARSHHTALKFGTLLFLLVAAAGLATTPIWVGALGAGGARS